MTPAEQRPADLPTWPSPAVEQLCGEDTRFERVPADEPFARSVLEQVADEGEVLLFAAARGHWAKAHTLSYDAARKSDEALLLARGWRVTSRRGGAHQAVAAVVDAWLGPAPPPGPRIARKFSAAVVARHSEEYPHPRDPARTDRELRELALELPTALVEVPTHDQGQVRDQCANHAAPAPFHFREVSLDERAVEECEAHRAPFGGVVLERRSAADDEQRPVWVVASHPRATESPASTAGTRRQ